MFRYKRVVLGILILVGGVLANLYMLLSPSPASVEAAPYLYYYCCSGLTIERADGSNRFQSSGELFPEGCLALEDGAWSPSGQWFKAIARTEEALDYSSRDIKGMWRR